MQEGFEHVPGLGHGDDTRSASVIDSIVEVINSTRVDNLLAAAQQNVADQRSRNQPTTMHLKPGCCLPGKWHLAALHACMSEMHKIFFNGLEWSTADIICKFKLQLLTEYRVPYVPTRAGNELQDLQEAGVAEGGIFHLVRT